MTGTAHHRLASRELPRVPSPPDVRIQRLGRMPRPTKALRAGQQVETRIAGGVPVTWLDPALADRGVLATCTAGRT